MLGRTLAHYEILAHLGTCGMGEVFRARDTELDREVACTSDESGRAEVHVVSWPEAAHHQQISVDGGGEPACSRDGTAHNHACDVMPGGERLVSVVPSSEGDEQAELFVVLGLGDELRARLEDWTPRRRRCSLGGPARPAPRRAGDGTRGTGGAGACGRKGAVLMLREIHEHVVSELQQAARADTVFVVTAVLFNLIVLGINWGVASEATRGGGGANDAILVLLIIAAALINFFAVRALLAGRDTRSKLITGLIAMYEDNGVAKYYDAGLLDTYGTRYRLFVAVLTSLFAISVVVPLMERFMGGP